MNREGEPLVHRDMIDLRYVKKLIEMMDGSSVDSVEITSDKGRVTIGENAVIKGDVSAGEVKVYGKIEGKITSERCELKDKSRINGDIKSKVFSMEEGAQLSGRTEIGG